MIDKALGFIVAELNAFLGVRYPSSEDHAVLASLTHPDGSAPPHTANRLVVSLVNLEREASAATNGVSTRAEGGYSRTSPALHLNLYILVTASFVNNYPGALTFLSAALGFFQAKPNFDAQSSPAFPREMERLSLELVSLSIQELNNLWAILGAKYLPSAMYKVRMLTFQQGWIGAAVPEVGGTDASVSG
ncbi:MAG: DUF4255 domain-containing protein [Burkholderiaceae bacterium]|nr:DUF4255 domain-containing protein [Burkholderiaceae bacterium]